MMKNQHVRNRGGSLLKIIRNFEDGNNILPKFANYDAIGSRIYCYTGTIHINTRSVLIKIRMKQMMFISL